MMTSPSLARLHLGSAGSALLRNPIPQCPPIPRLASRPLSSPPTLQLGSPSGRPCEPGGVGCQFSYRPVRPPVQSSSLALLPPAPFTLRIVSLSYNRANVHALLSPSFSPARSARYHDPAGHFSLSAIAPHHAASPPIPPYTRSLGSCFSPADRARWLARRANRRPPRTIYELRLTFALRIKELHKSAVIRKSIRKRWVAALKLVLQYGSRLTPAGLRSLNTPRSQADDDPDQMDLIELDPKEANPERWLLPDHYYIVHPNLSLNTVGLPELVHSIRAGLASIKQSASYGPPSSLQPRNQAGLGRPSRPQAPSALPFDRHLRGGRPPGLDTCQATRDPRSVVRQQQPGSRSGAHQQPHTPSHNLAHAHAQNPPSLPGKRRNDAPPRRLPTTGSLITSPPRSQPPRKLPIPQK